MADSPHWDPLWRRRLFVAAEELNLDHIVVNSRMMFRSKEDRDAAMHRTEELWTVEIARRKAESLTRAKTAFRR
jgi:hypothetical protein